MNALLQIFSVIPAVIAAIKAVEAAVPGAGNGKAKLDAVLEMIQSVDASFAEHGAALIGVIGSLVKLFNATGLFTKSAP